MCTHICAHTHVHSIHLPMRTTYIGIICAYTHMCIHTYVHTHICAYTHMWSMLIRQKIPVSTAKAVNVRYLRNGWGKWRRRPTRAVQLRVRAELRGPDLPHLLSLRCMYIYIYFILFFLFFYFYFFIIPHLLSLRCMYIYTHIQTHIHYIHYTEKGQVSCYRMCSLTIQCVLLL